MAAPTMRIFFEINKLTYNFIAKYELIKNNKISLDSRGQTHPDKQTKVINGKHSPKKNSII